MPRFSQRTALPREPNALSQALAARIAAGLPVLDGTASNPTEARLPYAQDDIRRALGDAAALRYEPSAQGARATREAIAGFVGHVHPDHLLVTASTSEAYGLLWKTLCDPGDAVLVPTPSYPLFDMLAKFEGVTAVPYPLRYDGAWHVDGSALAKVVAEHPRARAVVTVNPNNPTGHFVDDDDWRTLTAPGLPVVSDEVFLPYVAEGAEARAVSILGREGPLRIALGGLSKAVALPQVKLGWIAVAGAAQDRNELLERLALVSDAYLSASTPAQVAAPTLLRVGAVTSDEIRARCARNLRVLDDAVHGTAITRLRRDGGWYVVLRLPSTHTDEAWALRLLTEDGVSVQPGYFYDLPGTHLVLSLLAPEEAFAEITALLVRRVAADV